jgi:hypothetical protein
MWAVLEKYMTLGEVALLSQGQFPKGLTDEDCHLAILPELRINPSV